METIFTIIGWLIVIWLGGSLIYSVQFHLRSYLQQRQSIKNDESGNVYRNLHKKINWQSLIIIQVLKLAVIAILLYFLL